MQRLPADDIVPARELFSGPIENTGHRAVPHQLDVRKAAERLCEGQTVRVVIVQRRFGTEAVISENLPVECNGEKRQHPEIWHIARAGFFRVKLFQTKHRERAGGLLLSKGSAVRLKSGGEPAFRRPNLTKNIMGAAACFQLQGQSCNLAKNCMLKRISAEATGIENWISASLSIRQLSGAGRP